MGSIDFNQLFSMHSKHLHYLAFSYTKDKFMAEDIVQESFLKAYKKRETIEDTKKLRAWLSAITARTAIDFLRAEKRKSWMLVDPSIMDPLLGPVSAELTTEEEVSIRLLKEDLNHTMEQLTKESQEVLILKSQFGFNEKEIASLLQLKSSTVKTRLYRARKQLKQAIADKISA